MYWSSARRSAGGTVRVRRPTSSALPSSPWVMMTRVASHASRRDVSAETRTPFPSSHVSATFNAAASTCTTTWNRSARDASASLRSSASSATRPMASARCCAGLLLLIGLLVAIDGSPTQPMRTGAEAAVPAVALVELIQECEQPVGCGVEMGRKHGDGKIRQWLDGTTLDGLIARGTRDRVGASYAPPN